MTMAVDLGRKATKQTKQNKSMDEFEFRSDPITDYGVSLLNQFQYLTGLERFQEGT